jgi:hypothetical protein
MMVYIIMFNLTLPALVEMVLFEFKKLIEFNLLNPEGIVKLFYEFFSMARWINGISEKVINEDQEVSFFAALIVYITLSVVFLIVMLAVLVVKKLGSKKVQEYIVERKKKMVK